MSTYRQWTCSPGGPQLMGMWHRRRVGILPRWCPPLPPTIDVVHDTPPHRGSNVTYVQVHKCGGTSIQRAMYARTPAICATVMSTGLLYRAAVRTLQEEGKLRSGEFGSRPMDRQCAAVIAVVIPSDIHHCTQSYREIFISDQAGDALQRRVSRQVPLQGRLTGGGGGCRGTTRMDFILSHIVVRGLFRRGEDEGG